MFKKLKISRELKALFLNGVPRRKYPQIERVYARLFLSDDGKKVLAHMQAQCYERSLGMESSDQALRFQEGQRSFVAMIFRMVDLGRRQTP